MINHTYGCSKCAFINLCLEIACQISLDSIGQKFGALRLVPCLIEHFLCLCSFGLTVWYSHFSIYKILKNITLIASRGHLRINTIWNVQDLTLINYTFAMLCNINPEYKLILQQTYVGAIIYFLPSHTAMLRVIFTHNNINYKFQCHIFVVNKTKLNLHIHVTGKKIWYIKHILAKHGKACKNNLIS